jgi:hypothetical protein
MHLHHGSEFRSFDGNDGLAFAERLRNEQARLSRLQHLIARKQSVLKDATTRLRLGVSVDEVALAIVQVCRAELRDLDLAYLGDSDQ